MRSLVLILAVAACARGPVEGAAAALGRPGRVVLSLTGGLAGLADTTTIDSESGLLVRRSCLTIRGAANGCSANVREWRVPLGAATVDSIFRATQTAEFLALRGEYDMSGTFVDGPAYALRVTTTSGTRTIRWSDAPGVPVVLTTFRETIQRRTAD